MHMRRATLAALASFGSLVAALSFALPAAAMPSLPDLSAIRATLPGDAITAFDQAEYARGDFSARFHVNFQPHVRVCDIAAAGDANCDARVITDSRGAPHAVTAPAGMGPVNFLKAYGLSGQSSASKPPVIAIVDAYGDPNIQSDLNTYSATFGIPTLPSCSGAVANSATPCFQKVDQNGGTNYPSTNSGWALETSLDVEAAHATCQNCSILLVQASSNSFSNLMAAVDRALALGANVVSNSYGANEFSGENTYDSHFNHPGVAFTFSAGDSGYGVEYPAASPYVTAVGGTSLFLNSDGSYNSESAWSGTGSGCSAIEGKPSWQTDSGCANRTVTDVSADADPNTGAAVYDSVSYNGQSGWFQVGGTSLASPLIAATYALGGVSGNVQANSLPYSQGSSTNLNDVLTGSNGACGGSYLCTALLGYDGPTGLGTPKGTSAFSNSAPPPPPTPSVNITATPSSVYLGSSSTLSWSTADVSSCSASGDWSGTEPTSGSQSVTPSATGTFTYTLTCTGADGSATNSASVNVSTAPVQSFSLSASPTSLSISRGRSASDTISVIPAGGFTGAVTLSVSGLPSGVSASFGTNPTTTSSSLRISVTRRAVVGTYTLTIHGVSGSLSASTNLTLTVR